ncbi:MAG: cell division protein FtsW [Candidatus Magasanikbacteria bacterium RIFCSPHIGHO2_01_FULL_47_8]|uniref:Probable peptidoglycan glycosyltransferase FtsW n=1 Tax=Candidatus Magasanikbacteria bacterium RIFCSPHIGHO2_01_FULL_47_8 TaxID=1798673 RepID=A0A1F6MGD9_9BACT|nr:MAG: cell division protein FtsW [Candidatus Magasanikbacteria bacterium RIFCSPHIGHO2_01_FULL_47_8]
MKKKPDYFLLFTVLSLIAVGIIALLSASSIESKKDFGNIYSYFVHQLVFGIGAGAVLGFVAYHVDYRRLKRFAVPLLVGSIALLILVFIPAISVKSGGARSWLNIFGVSIQPSEILKLTFVIYLAAWFDKKNAAIKKWSEGFVPFVILAGIVGVLILLQPDVGTLGVIMMIGLSMYFIAGAKISQIGAVMALGLGLAGFLIKIAPHRVARWDSFLDPSSDPFGAGYQLNQALLAVGSGGIFGVGIGKSLQKYSFLPEPMKDSIFAIWAEELGLVGAVFIVVLFIFVGLRGMKIAKEAKDGFGRLLASGITVWIVVQAFVNIGSMMALVPLTGIPLPFISYGGSAMVATLAATGVLLNISKMNSK